MDLPSYIAQIGIAEAAKRFRVSYRAAASWRAGERVPKRSNAQYIERVTKGEVSLSEALRGRQ